MCDLLRGTVKYGSQMSKKRHKKNYWQLEQSILATDPLAIFLDMRFC